MLLKTETKPRSTVHRSRIDIMACILENSNGCSTKTRLIDRCNLNPSNFDLYKNFLVETGLLNVSRRKDGVEIFETSEKCKEFLRDYAQIKSKYEDK